MNLRSGYPQRNSANQTKFEKPKTVWVTILEAEISQLKGQRKIAIVMSAQSFEDAEDIDYLITNVEGEIVTPAMDS